LRWAVGAVPFTYIKFRPGFLDTDLGRPLRLIKFGGLFVDTGSICTPDLKVGRLLVSAARNFA
jgi:hypothetical protein